MADEHENEHAAPHHITPLTTYIFVFVALAAGTLLTWFASTVNLGWMNTPIALVIATTKAALVILFFMHGKYSTRRTQLVIISGFFWLAIMLGLTLTDYTARKPEPSRSANPPAAVIHRA